MLVEYTKGLGYERYEESRVTDEWYTYADFEVTERSWYSLRPVVMKRSDGDIFTFTVNVVKKC